MVELRAITDDNFHDCIELELAEGQDRFVAPNEYTLAEAYISLATSDLVPVLRAIYHDDTMVGFIAMAYQPATSTAPAFYEMYRFMVDRRHQGKGYGRAALVAAIAYLKTQPLGTGSHIATSFVPGNATAERLYTSLGFRITGELDGDEIVARYDL